MREGAVGLPATDLFLDAGPGCFDSKSLTSLGSVKDAGRSHPPANDHGFELCMFIFVPDNLRQSNTPAAKMNRLTI